MVRQVNKTYYKSTKKNRNDLAREEILRAAGTVRRVMPAVWETGADDGRDCGGGYCNFGGKILPLFDKIPTYDESDL